MPKEANGLDIQKAKSDVPDARLAFWFNNGVIVRNLSELAKALPTLDPQVFKYHVNPQKNDIYNWVLDVFKDDVLAEAIKGELNQKRLALKVSAHLSFINSPGNVPLMAAKATTPTKKK